MDIRRSHTPADIGFTVIINSVIEDERLTNGTLEVLIYLLSKPPGWIIRQADLKRRFGYGKDKQQAIFKQLEEAHYLMRECDRGDDGRFHWHHTVYDLPQDGEFDQYGHRRGHLKPVDPFKGV